MSTQTRDRENITALTPGDKGTPVWRTNFNGDYHKTAQSANTVIPTRWPWETPIGVLTEDVGVLGEYHPIQFNGTFEIQLDQLFYETTHMLTGKRVYFDQNYYCTIDYSGILHEANNRGRYPGAATIGYVESFDTSENKVKIRIDPQPPTATYKYLPLYGTMSTTAIGQPMYLNSYNNAVSSTHPTEDKGPAVGICCGKFSTGNGEYMVFCVKGPAWYRITSSVFYEYATPQSLVQARYPPSSIPITVDGRVFVDSQTANRRVLGTIDMAKWYTLSETEYVFPEILIMDVDVHDVPVAPTTTAETEAKEPFLKTEEPKKSLFQRLFG